MESWHVHLKGEQSDLEQFVRGFPTGRVVVIEDQGEFYITGSMFDSFSGATDTHRVQTLAAQNLDRMFLAISADDRYLTKPQIGDVIWRDENGQRHRFALAAAHAHGRSNAIFVGSQAAHSGLVDQSTSGQRLHALIESNPRLRAVAERWALRDRNWPHLAAIFDELEEVYRDRHGSTKGLCADAQRIRFKRSAQSAEVAGPHARHATGYAEPPANPMTLGEAEDFVHACIVKTIC